MELSVTVDATRTALRAAPTERLCHPPCGQAIIPCPNGDRCYKDQWVHKHSLTHECPGSESKTPGGLVVYGPHYARPS